MYSDCSKRHLAIEEKCMEYIFNSIQYIFDEKCILKGKCMGKMATKFCFLTTSIRQQVETYPRHLDISQETYGY